jgi:hypothetical protein
LFGVRAKAPPKCVILSDVAKRSGVRSRTFGRRSDNVAKSTPLRYVASFLRKHRSKRENCQDNFRDLVRFILSFGLKVTFYTQKGYIESFCRSLGRGQATSSPFFTLTGLKKGSAACRIVILRLFSLQYLGTPLRMTRLRGFCANSKKKSAERFLSRRV